MTALDQFGENIEPGVLVNHYRRVKVDPRQSKRLSRQSPR
jgi:hypothetical protein